MLNPNKYIRQAYINSLQEATGVPVWHKKVPKGATPPNAYIILDTQTKNQTVKAKINYFEWLCTLDVNIYNVNATGYSNAEVVDDLEEKVIDTIVEQGVQIAQFHNKNASILESLDLSVETSTQSVDRRLLKLEHWLCEIPEIPPPVAGLARFGWSLTNPVNNLQGVILDGYTDIFAGDKSYTLNFDDAANFKYLVVRELTTEPVKTEWLNLIDTNEGSIPDSKFMAPVIIGEYRYYFSRNPFVFDQTSNNLTLSTND